MAFRAEVRRALANGEGATLAQAFAAPKVTAIVADAGVTERDVVALSELADALVRVGTPRGRCLLLLAGTRTPDAATKERARQLRSTLGMPVVPHDPARASEWPGRELAGFGPFALDDELREAEAVVLVGRFARTAAGALHGGPALLLPGLADAATRERFATAAAADREAASFGVLAEVEVDWALVWDGADPPRVRAGTGAALFARGTAAP